MKVAVWGAGDIGKSLAYRLSVSPAVSSLYWINRTLEKIDYRRVDLEHGLAFAPSCQSIVAIDQNDAPKHLNDIEMVIITAGGPVPKGKTREEVYGDNCSVLKESIIPVLRDNFGGLVLVVTNPVDLMTRLLWKECNLDEHRVFGLGTVVETARLRASLGSHMIPIRPAREVWAYAVGTHDENFVPAALGEIGLGSSIDSDLEEVVDLARCEVAKGASRVKQDDQSTLHPVIEGIVSIVEAVALDTLAVLTVSVRDPLSAENLFYSLPCIIGRDGISERLTAILEIPSVAEGIKDCCEALRTTLDSAGDL